MGRESVYEKLKGLSASDFFLGGEAVYAKKKKKKKKMGKKGEGGACCYVNLWREHPFPSLPCTEWPVFHVNFVHSQLFLVSRYSLHLNCKPAYGSSNTMKL